MAVKRHEFSWKVARPHASIERRGDEEGWSDGLYYCEHGIVRCYSDARYSTYTTIVGGIGHAMSEQIGRTPRGLAIVAGRWIRRLHQEMEDGT